MPLTPDKPINTQLSAFAVYQESNGVLYLWNIFTDEAFARTQAEQVEGVVFPMLSLPNADFRAYGLE